MSQNSGKTNSGKSRPAVDELSYRAGVADGRVQAIEESMDAIAALLVKAETMLAALPPEADKAMRDNAQHTVRALRVAFAAVSGAKQDSAAFQTLLGESKARLRPDSTMH